MIFVSEEDLRQVILAIENGDGEDAIKLLEEIIEEESLNPN
jgi:hypothetical protein